MKCVARNEQIWWRHDTMKILFYIIARLLFDKFKLRVDFDLKMKYF